MIIKESLILNNNNDIIHIVKSKPYQNTVLQNRQSCVNYLIIRIKLAFPKI